MILINDILGFSMVSIEDLSKIELRIGRIIDVQDHEGARKPMYKLRVNLGEELGERIIVAGIRNVYSKEDLLGKEIVCVANLEPKLIAGIESNGMLLAAGEGENVSLLMPDKEIKEGSRIH